MRKSAVIIVLIVTVFAIFIGYKLIQDNSSVSNNDAIKFKNEYEILNNRVNPSNNMVYPSVNIPSNNIIKYSTYDEVFEILKEGTGVIFLGFPESPYSRSLIPVLLESADEVELDHIYYLNISDDRDLFMLDDNGKVITENKGTDNYYKLVDALKEILNDYVLTSSNGTKLNTKKKRIDLPLVIFVKNGKIVAHHFNTVKSHENAYSKLTDVQYEELLLKLMNYMGVVSGTVCDETCLEK